MNCPGAAARRTSTAASAPSTSSVCSTITTASAPRGTTPPVAMVVAVAGSTPEVGAWPQTTTSGLRRSRFGAVSLAPTVSAARNAKPSTLERSNGGTSIGALTSCASTRPSDTASVTRSAGNGARSTWRAKRARASSAETTSRNCSCRAARRIVSIRSWLAALLSKRSLMATVLSRPRFPPANLRCSRLRQSSRRCSRVAPAANSRRLWARPGPSRGAPGRSRRARSATRPCARAAQRWRGRSPRCSPPAGR